MEPWESTTASAHFFVDDKECIINVPIDEKAWHVLYDTPTDNYYFEMMQTMLVWGRVMLLP